MTTPRESHRYRMRGSADHRSLFTNKSRWPLGEIVNRRLMILVPLLTLGSTALGATMPNYYCTSESNSIDSDKRQLSWQADSLKSKVSYLNSLMSQINSAQRSSYSSTSYVNSLIGSYNIQLGSYKSSITSYNYSLDRLNRRIDSYNSSCTGR